MANEVMIAGLSSTALAGLYEMFGGPDRNSDLAEGVLASFPVLSFKGKVWRVKFKGEEKVVLNPDGDPVSTIHAVLIKASPHISKLYYDKTYTEGDDAAPLCFSLDGIKPDRAAEKKQSETCATCPHNVWGSKITENGNKTKACADSRRVAVTPYPDLHNEAYGGPMLLRVPPASLASLVKLKEQLDQVKVPYQAVVVKISFDHQLAYPKLVFTPVKALNLDEAMVVKDFIEGDTLDRMFSDVVDEGSEDAAAPAPAAAATKPKPNTGEATARTAKATTKPAPAEEQLEADLSSALGSTPAAAAKPAAANVKEQALDEGEEVGAELENDLDSLLKSALG